MSERVFSGKYEVQQEIAQGAMGIVYKALDQKLNRVVALKVVHPHLTNDASFLQRFLREARAMARLQHNNIVTIYSVEQDQGMQFMVMEYFPGGNLHGRIQSEKGLPLAKALAVTTQIANALAYAHSHGIIHRDIKPANVLIGTDDRIKLTDFGIAAALDEAPLTTAGQLIGTLLYMSPEQAKDAGLDGRSDLYSLGLMLYEMVTGSHPRRGLSNTAVLGMLATETALPPVSFPPDIPRGVQTLINDLLRYRPVDRIHDAKQLLDRLETLQFGGQPVPRVTPLAQALVDDRTMCELEDLPRKPPSPPSEKPPQPTEEKRPSRVSAGTTATTIFGIIAVLLLGFLGLNSWLNSSMPAPQLSKTERPPNTNTSDSTPSSLRPDSATPVPQVDLADTQARLNRLRRAVTTKDLAELDMLSVMSEDRRNWVRDLFRNYNTIEASLGEVVATSTDITSTLRIEKLILPTGETFPVGPSLQKIRLTIARKGDTWGKIQW